jgi:hypothetical protein
MAKHFARMRRQYAGALVIQRHWRGYHCRASFQIWLRCDRAARRIKCAYRQYRRRCLIHEVRWKEHYATLIQSCWRRRKAQLVARAQRQAFFLNGAARGDYAVVLRGLNHHHYSHDPHLVPPHTGIEAITDAEGNSILHLACLSGSKRVLKLCLRYEMDINLVNAVTGRTPLHMAIASQAVYVTERTT